MEFPRVPLNMGVVALLMQSDYGVETTRVDDELKPFASQYDISPGDCVLISNTNSEIDSDFTMAKVLDPSAWAETFPDWENRLRRSRLLCEYKSLHHPQPEIGWFSRVRMMLVTEDQYQEVENWIEERPTSAPQWIKDLIANYADALAEVSPDRMPVSVTCEECGSNDVQLHTLHTTRAATMAGMVTRDGQTFFVNRSDIGTQCLVQAHLHCESCNARAELEPETVGFDISNPPS